MGGITKFFKEDSIARWLADDSLSWKLRRAFATSDGNDRLTRVFAAGGSKAIIVPDWREHIEGKKFSKMVFVDQQEALAIIERGLISGQTVSISWFFTEEEAEETRRAITEAIGSARKW